MNLKERSQKILHRLLKTGARSKVPVDLSLLFLSKIKRYCAAAGTQVFYSILLLYHAYKRSETPTWAKRIVLGSFAYLLAPLDAIPDLAPFIGFTDDLGVLMFGLASIAGYVNDDVRSKSKSILSQWIKDLDPADLAEVDRRL